MRCGWHKGIEIDAGARQVERETIAMGGIYPAAYTPEEVLW